MATLECEGSVASTGLFAEEPLPSYREILCKTCQIGIAQVSVFVITLINYTVIGHGRAADEAQLLAMQAGLGLGVTFIAVVVAGVNAGLASVADTIVSQSAGRNNMETCVVCMGQIRTLQAVYWLLVVLPLALCFERLLLACEVDPAASYYAGVFVRILSPGMLLRGHSTLLRRFLATIGRPAIAPWATSVQVLVHLGLVAFLGFRLPIDALAWVTNITFAVPNVLIMGYLLWRPGCFGLERRWLIQHAFVCRGLRAPLCLGLGASVQLVAEELALQTYVLMSARLGNVAVAASSICFGILGSIYAIGIGLGGTASGLVGAAVGRGHRVAARRTAWRCATMAASLGFPFIAGLLLAAAPLSAQFSEDRALQDELVPLLRLLGFSQTCEFVMATLSSALRAANHPKVGPIVIVSFYYPVVVPFAYILAFPAGLGTLGMWLSYTGGTIAVSGILAGICWKVL